MFTGVDHSSEVLESRPLSKYLDHKVLEPMLMVFLNGLQSFRSLAIWQPSESNNL